MRQRESDVKLPGSNPGDESQGSSNPVETLSRDLADSPIGKNGKPLKKGFRDADKRLIQSGDLFVLTRDRKYRADYRIFDKELADKTYAPTRSRYTSYSTRMTLKQNGTVHLRAWIDEHGTNYKKVRTAPLVGGHPNVKYEPTPAKRIVGRPVEMPPGAFGIILGRHEHRPSQWHAIIGGRHYSVSNKTVRVIRGELEFERAQRQVEESNANISKEEWHRVMRSRLGL